MNLSCDVIRDLLPLYADRAASADTAALVEEHLASCPACREELRRLGAALPAEPEGAEPLRCDLDACAALGVEVVRRPVATVVDGYVRHQSDALARELILLHAERNVRIAGDRFNLRDAYRKEGRK